MIVAYYGLRIVSLKNLQQLKKSIKLEFILTNFENY